MKLALKSPPNSQMGPSKSYFEHPPHSLLFCKKRFFFSAQPLNILVMGILISETARKRKAEATASWEQMRINYMASTFPHWCANYMASHGPMHPEEEMAFKEACVEFDASPTTPA